MNAQGIVLRDKLEGAAIKTKSQQICRTGDFLVAEIDAKNGGFGIVPAELDGAIVSSHYFLFEIDETCLDRRFLSYYLRTHDFRGQVEAQGTTNYAAIRPAHVLDYRMPLPPLAEQRRIVTRIEGLAGKIAEVKRLKTQAEVQFPLLAHNLIHHTFSRLNAPEIALGELIVEQSRNGLGSRPQETPIGFEILRISAATSRPDAIVNEQDHKYLDLDDEVATTYRLKPGDLLACRFNGNLAFVGRFALYLGKSQHPQLYPDKLIRFRVDETRVLPAYVRYAMNSPDKRKEIESFCATTAGNIGISAADLKRITIPVPNLAIQKQMIAQIDAIQAKIEEVQKFLTGSQAELDALLPSILYKAFRGQL